MADQQDEVVTDLAGREWSKTALGVRIDLKTDRAVAGQPSFTGGYRGAASGAVGAIPAGKSGLEPAGPEGDLDAAMGIEHHPGTAGAHPVVAHGPLSTMPPAHDEPQPEPLPDNEDNSENSEDAAKKRSLLGRMWSKVAMGVHLDIHSDHAVAGQPSFTGGFAGGGSAGAGPIAQADTHLGAIGPDHEAEHPGTAGAHPVMAKGPL